MKERIVEGVALAVILGGAAFFRFYQLGSIPPGIDLDEARNGVEALRVLAGSHPLFFTTFDPREPAFIYSLTLAVSALGHTALAMRVTGAVWGLLGVALTYPVARQWFGRRVALLATAGMAASLWELMMSRWTERDITLLPPLLLFLFFFWRGFERRSTWSFALAGVFASACAYAYVAARILPLLIVLILLGQWLLARDSIACCRKGLLVGLGTAAATIAPLAAYFARNPDVFFSRIGHISSLAAPLPGEANESLWRTALNTLGMFFVHGDVNWRDDVAAKPVFVPVLAAAFCFGVVVALRYALTSAKAVHERLGEPPAGSVASLRLYPCLWLLLWQVTLLIPAFLARPSPQYDRTIGAAPSTYMLFALGLAAIPGWPKLTNAIGGAAVVALGVLTFQAYFRVYPAAAQPRHVFEYGQAADAAVLNQRQPLPTQTFIFLGHESGLAMRYLAPRYDGATWLEDFSQLMPIPTSGAATYVFAEPSLPTNGDLPAIAQQYFPKAAMVGKASFLNGDQAGRVFEVTPEQIAAFQGVQRPLDASFGDKVRLDSVSLDESRIAAQPGQDVRLGLTWSVLAASQDNYAAFVHVVDGSGKVVAQDDRQGLPTGGWRPGQRFLSLHDARLPADATPGEYRVLAGLDRRTANQPSQSLGELGAQVEVVRMEVDG